MKPLRTNKNLNLLVLFCTSLSCCCLLAASAQQAATTTTIVTSGSSLLPSTTIETTTGSSVITSSNPFSEQAPRMSTSSNFIQTEKNINLTEQRVPTTTTSLSNPTISTTTTTSQQPTTFAQTTRTYQFVRPKIGSSSAPPPPPTTITATTTTTTTTSKAFNQQCLHNNKTYSIGQQWNDDCAQVCECIQVANSDSVSACRPRCPTYNDPPGDNCKLVRSKQDECCLEWNCELEAKFAPSSQPQTTTTTTTTVMQTEKGQFEMSTTEIKMTTQPSVVQVKSKPTISQLAEQKSKKSSVLANESTSTEATTTTSKQTNEQQVKQKNLLAKEQASTRGAKNFPLPTTTTTTTSNLNKQQVRAETTTAASITYNDGPDLSADNGDQKSVNASTADLCIVSENEAYPVGDSWNDTACDRLCRCVFEKEPRNLTIDFLIFKTLNLKSELLVDGQLREPEPTELRCSLPARCVPIVQRQLKPRADCPAPGLQLPQLAFSMSDTCHECPKVSCSSQVKQQPTSRIPSTTIMPPTTTNTNLQPKEKLGCKKLGNQGEVMKVMAFGETFMDECHSICRCHEDGIVRCEAMQCPSVPSESLLEELGCKDWQLDPSFQQNSAENKCCANFVCRKPSNPIIEESSPPPTTTTTTTTTTSSSPSSSSTSQEDETPEEAITTPVEINNKNKSCLLLGKLLSHGQRVPEDIQPRITTTTTTTTTTTSSNNGLPEEACQHEKVCTCLDGRIVCEPVGATCLPLNEEPPACPTGSNAAQLIDMETCCPKWGCQINESYALKDFRVIALNSSSVEIQIELPLFALNRVGRIQLNYTSAPINERGLSLLPAEEARWLVKPKIRTQDGIFFEQLIKYYLSGLKSDHQYWFKVFVIFEGANEAPFKEPIESDLESVAIPSPPVDLEQSTTTTTTTTIAPETTTSKFYKSTTPASRILRPTSLTRQQASSTTTTSAPPSVAVTQPPTSRKPKQRLESETFTVKPDPLDNLNDLLLSSQSSTATTTTTTTSSTTTTQQPCTEHENQNAGNSIENDNLNGPFSAGVHSPIHPYWPMHEMSQISLQRYAAHLAIGLILMTILFVIVSCLYMKKSVHVIAPITSASHFHPSYQDHSYDNFAFSKLVNYKKQQPVNIFVDEATQNYDNDAIMAKQKNLELDCASPLNNNNNNNINGTKRTPTTTTTTTTTNLNNGHHHNHHHHNHHHPPHQLPHQNGGKQNLI